MERQKRLCMMPVCKNERFNLVHKFPQPDVKALDWLKSLKMEHLLDGMSMQEIRNRHFLCSRHFKASDYKNPASRHLNTTAFPSINLTALDNFDVIDKSIMNRSYQDSSDQSHEVKTRSNSNVQSNLTMKRLRMEDIETEPVPPPKVKILNLQINKTSNIVSPTPQKSKVHQNKNDYIVVLPTGKVLMKIPSANTKITKTVAKIERLSPDEPEITPQLVQSRVMTREDPPITVMADKLILKEEGIEVNNFWLRDHCRCDLCFNHGTFQRRINILDIPLDIQPESAVLENNTLYVKWPDNHESEYELSFLRKNTLNSLKKNPIVSITWNRDLIQRFSYARVAMTDYLCDEQVAKNFVQSLVDYGVAFVEKVPPNAMFTEIVIKRLFSVHKTLFGEIWTFADGSSDSHMDTAYTSERLPAHTDNTYFNDASGLQVLHCIEYEAKGGESLLVDGFEVLKRYKSKEPESYERLKNTPVRAEYIEKNAHHTYTAPIIIENKIDNSVEQIRYNIADRAPFSTLPVEEMSQFYSDLRKLAKEVENPVNEWWFQLKPGTVMFFNNWRLLHGRGAFSGKRVMCGGYVSRTEFMSVARKMGIIN